MNGFGPVQGMVVVSLPQIDPDNPMNQYYAQQAELHARRNPSDANAQRLWYHWVTSLQQIEQARRAGASSAPAGRPSQNPFSMPGLAAPAPVPSFIPGAEAPTPPATANVLSQQFGQGRAGPSHGCTVQH